MWAASDAGIAYLGGRLTALAPEKCEITMTERITKKFVTARLVTTTNNWRRAGVLTLHQSITFDQTGSDKYPWRLVVLAIEDDGRRVVSNLTGATTWAGLNAAVDGLYELSWMPDLNK